jgi:hypothetical protein
MMSRTITSFDRLTTWGGPVKNRITSVIAAATVLVAGAATSASAGPLEEARWQGTFDVTQTYKVDELNPDVVGESDKRVHTIKSTCSGTKACGKVKFSRVAGDGTKYTYALKRTEPGTYKGSDSYQTSWWCTKNGEKVYTWTGQGDETLTLKAKAEKSGKVSKYRGTLKILYPPYTTEGVPQGCLDFFGGQGFEEGHRPVVKVSLVGVLR